MINRNIDHALTELKRANHGLTSARDFARIAYSGSPGERDHAFAELFAALVEVEAAISYARQEVEVAR